MKLILLLFCAVSLNCLSQNDWTKDDRNNLYDEYLGSLTKHKNLTSEQKETIGLCCLEATTTKYTKKDFTSKIEIEVKRIHESIIGQCAKNMGVTLDVQTIETEQKTVVSSPEWTREDKEQLAKDFNLYIAKYDHLTDDQKETLSLCYISNSTALKTKKEYFDMIQIELNKFKQTSISNCARNNKIDLEKMVETNTNVISKANLIGSWKTDKGTTITFNENGTFLKTFHENILINSSYNRIKDQTTSGDWFMDGSGILTLTEKWIEVETKLLKTNLYSNSSKGKFKFESLTKDFFKITLIEGNACCQEANEPVSDVTQANKVK